MGKTKELSESRSSDEIENFAAEAKKNLDEIRSLFRKLNVNSFHLASRLHQASLHTHYQVEGYSGLPEWLDANGYSSAPAMRLLRTYTMLHEAGATLEDVEDLDPEALYQIKDIILKPYCERIIKDAREMPREAFLHKWKSRMQKHHEASQAAALAPLPKKRKGDDKKPPMELEFDEDDRGPTTSRGGDSAVDDDDDDDDAPAPIKSSEEGRFDQILGLVTAMTPENLQKFLPIMARRLGEGFVVMKFMMDIVKGFSDDEMKLFLKELVRLDQVARVSDAVLIGYLVAKLGAFDSAQIPRVAAEVEKVRKRLGIE